MKPSCHLGDAKFYVFLMTNRDSYTGTNKCKMINVVSYLDNIFTINCTDNNYMTYYNMTYGERYQINLNIIFYRLK